MKSKRNKVLLLVAYLSGIICVAGMSDVWVELRAPRFVVHHHSAVLRCDHNVDPETLYKVVFFKNGQRIMKFVRGRDPPYELYNFTGADINHSCMRYVHEITVPKYRELIKDKHHGTNPLSVNNVLLAAPCGSPAILQEQIIVLQLKVVPKINVKPKTVANRPDSNSYQKNKIKSKLAKLSPTSITLDRLDFAASGPYACEIAIETPLYSKVSKLHEINVIVRQKHRPKIKIKHKKLSSSDHLEATCQSAAAYPSPHLTWFINNSKVDEKLTVPHGSVNTPRHHGGMPLLMTSSSLHYPLSNMQLSPNQTVEISCISTIPSYAHVNDGFADVQNHSVTVNVIRLEPAPTQLPVKIVSAEFNDAIKWQPSCLLIFFIIIVCHSSF